MISGLGWGKGNVNVPTLGQENVCKQANREIRKRCQLLVLTGEEEEKLAAALSAADCLPTFFGFTGSR